MIIYHFEIGQNMPSNYAMTSNVGHGENMGNVMVVGLF